MTHGVLGSSYASRRGSSRTEAGFRLRVRAGLAASILRHHLGARSLRIVDFGSADGRGLLELARRLGEGQYWGIEASPELLALAPPETDQLVLLQGDVSRLPGELAAGTFDAVTALALLEHLPQPECAVAEAARILRPGGIFVATCPHAFWDHLSTRLGLLDDGQHEGHLGRRELERLAVDAGLEVVSFTRFMLAPVGVLPYFRIPVSPDLALVLDRWVGNLRLFEWLFVNQCLVARKPGRT